jgi:hypothetical protein
MIQPAVAGSRRKLRGRTECRSASRTSPSARGAVHRRRASTIYVGNVDRATTQPVGPRLLFGCYALDRWLLLGAWNGDAGFPVDNPQAGLDIIVLCVLVGLFAAVRYEVLPAMIAGTALLGVWCYFHLATW